MRYRRVKFEGEKRKVVEDATASQPKQYRGRWNEFFGNDNPIFLEMGCGKGKFITTLAETNPQCNYIGVEGQEGVVLRAAEKAHKKELKNVTFICEFLHDLQEYFGDGEIEGLYLNFSDPWPKARHAKRRLTHKRFLDKYKKMIRIGGTLEFKTDNDNLFAFSVVELEENHYEILEISYDLHNSNYVSSQITTEYEEKFKAWGNKIKYLKAVAR